MVSTPPLMLNCVKISLQVNIFADKAFILNFKKQ